MPRLTRLLLLALAGCAAAPAPAGRFRDPAVPMFSAALFDPAAAAGSWTEAAAFGGGSCGGGGVEIAADLAVAGRLCLGGTSAAVQGQLEPFGPGRFRLAGTGEWWVLWVDSGYRTMAIGTPDGSWGTVLNRDGPLPEDRLAAAAEIFDFNGYDTGRLARLARLAR